MRACVCVCVENAMRERISRARRRVEQSRRRTSRRFFLLSRKGHREYASAPSSWFTFSSLVHLLLLRGTCRSQVYERAGYRHHLLVAPLSVAVWSLPGSRGSSSFLSTGYYRAIINPYLSLFPSVALIGNRIYCVLSNTSDNPSVYAVSRLTATSPATRSSFLCTFDTRGICRRDAEARKCQRGAFRW